MCGGQRWSRVGAEVGGGPVRSAGEGVGQKPGCAKIGIVGLSPFQKSHYVGIAIIVRSSRRICYRISFTSSILSYSWYDFCGIYKSNERLIDFSFKKLYFFFLIETSSSFRG